MSQNQKTGRLTFQKPDMSGKKGDGLRSRLNQALRGPFIRETDRRGRLAGPGGHPVPRTYQRALPAGRVQPDQDPDRDPPSGVSVNPQGLDIHW